MKSEKIKNFLLVVACVAAVVGLATGLIGLNAANNSMKQLQEVKENLEVIDGNADIFLD